MILNIKEAFGGGGGEVRKLLTPMEWAHTFYAKNVKFREEENMYEKLFCMWVYWKTTGNIPSTSGSELYDLYESKTG